MKKLLAIALSVPLLLVTSCGKQDAADASAADSVATNSEPKIESMEIYSDTASVQAGGQTLYCEILREPCDSLPTVKDELDNEYRDNSIRIQCRRGGASYFNHVFTKGDFRSGVDASLYEVSLLSGARFVDYKAGRGFLFTVSVGEPYSDMSQRFRLVVADNGTFSVTPDEAGSDMQ